MGFNSGFKGLIIGLMILFFGYFTLTQFTNLDVGTLFVSSHAHSFAFLTRRKALRKVKKENGRRKRRE